MKHIFYKAVQSNYKDSKIKYACHLIGNIFYRLITPIARKLHLISGMNLSKFNFYPLDPVVLRSARLEHFALLNSKNFHPRNKPPWSLALCGMLCSIFDYLIISALAVMYHSFAWKHCQEKLGSWRTVEMPLWNMTQPEVPGGAPEMPQHNPHQCSNTATEWESIKGTHPS